MAPKAVWADVVWEEHLDPKTGRMFYHNRGTGETTWTKPDVLPIGWSEHIDVATNRKYYFNKETGKSTWTKPQVAPAHAELVSVHVEAAPSRTDIMRAREDVSPSRGAVVKRRPQSALSTRSPAAMTATTACIETADDWREHNDSSTGKLFYVSKTTGRISWTRPTEATSEISQVARAASALVAESSQENPWTEHVDPTTGKIFYHNEKTKTSAWEKPVELVVDNPLEKSAAAADCDVCRVNPVAMGAAAVDHAGDGIGRLPHGWTEHVDNTSRKTFYHNETTRESTWEKPAEKSERKPADQSKTEPANKSNLKATEIPEQSKTEPASRSHLQATEIPVGECTAGQWESGWDPRRRKRFYYSAMTGDSFWEMPKHLPVLQLIEDLSNLSVACQEAAQAEELSDRRRFEVRDGTKAKVAKELGLSEFGRPAAEARSLPPGARDTTLFLDSGQDLSGGSSCLSGQLLGRFDVLAVQAAADFDASWRYTRTKKNRFWVLHAAAINIGESARARDFPDYQDNGGHLDLAAYIEDMGRIFDNLLCSAARLTCRDLVWFPFGMGAFLRNLHENDAWYSKDHKNGQLLVELRHALAQRFVSSVEKTADLTLNRRLHICVSPTERGNEERDANAAAFLKAIREALRASAAGRSRRSMTATAWVVHVHGDSLSVVQELANQGRSVALVNGANRNLIGNHWFANGARFAIDENLHRRSWSMAALAYMLNDGARVQSPCSSDVLADRVRRMGGRVEHQSAAFRTQLRAGIISKFREMDRDGNGFVSKDEFAKVANRLGINEAELDASFSSIDVDQDGRVSYVEFVNWLYGWKRPKEARQYAVMGDA